VDGALELASTVLGAGAAFVEKAFGSRRQAELKGRGSKAIAEESVQRFELQLKDLLDGRRVEWMIGERAIDAIDELGEKRRRTACRPMAWSRAGSAAAPWLAAKPKRSVSSRDISLAPRLDVRKMRDRSKLTVLLSPSLSEALSSTPSRSRPREERPFPLRRTGRWRGRCARSGLR